MPAYCSICRADLDECDDPRRVPCKLQLELDATASSKEALADLLVRIAEGIRGGSRGPLVTCGHRDARASFAVYGG